MKARTARTRNYIDYDANVGSFAVEGNTAVTGTLSSSGALTTTSGGHTITAGGLTVTAGGATVTAGNVVATAGNITATAGNIVATAGAVSAGTTVTAGAGLRATTAGLIVTAGATDLACNGTDDVDYVSGNGAKCTIQVKTEDIALTAGGTTSTSTGWIPADSAVIAMTAKVTVTCATGDRTTLALSSPTGSITWMSKAATLDTTWSCGTMSTATPIAPYSKVFASAENLVFTVSGGSTGNIPAGAKVRVTMWYLTLTDLTS